MKWEMLMDQTTDKVNVYSAAQLKSTFELVDDRWYHIVFTHTSAGSKLYIDGVLDNSNLNSAGAMSSQVLRIGGYNGASQPLNGTLDEFAIWNRSL